MYVSAIGVFITPRWERASDVGEREGANESLSILSVCVEKREMERKGERETKPPKHQRANVFAMMWRTRK